jgi:hypothetical protein
MQQQWLALTEEGIWSRTIEELGGNLHIKIISDFGGCMWVYNTAAISGDRHVSTATLLSCMASTAVCWRKQSLAFGEWRQGLSHCSDFGTNPYTVSTDFLPGQGWTSKPICISPQIYPPIQCLCKSSAVLALASQHHFLCLHRIRFNAGVADSCYMLSSRISKLTCQINTADLDDILTFA